MSARDSTRPRTWTIEMPAGMELLNANDRLHWAARARISRTIRDAAHILTRKQKVPRLERARIVCVYEPPDRRTRDRSNWHPSAKAATDGVVDAGVLADDSDAYLDGPHVEIGDVHPRGRLVLHVTEVLGETPEVAR